MNCEKYIESLSSNVGDSLRGYLEDMKAFYSSKHWFQLGETILRLLRDESLYSQNIALIDFYNNFVAHFESKLLENTLADIAHMISATMSDPNEALSFLSSISERVTKSSEAKQKCLISRGFIFLRINMIEEVKAIVDSVGDELDIFGDLSQVHGLYFKLAAEYHKIMSNHTKYYKMELNFMSCEPCGLLFGGKFFQSLIDISRSAILSPDIINLQEWLQHRAVKSLVGSDFEWLMDLMVCITDGDHQLLHSRKQEWINRDDDFARNFEVIHQKVCLNALIRMRFKGNSVKLFSFEDISRETGVEQSEVESLVMLGMAKNVIRGYIDEVVDKVYIEWAYPRVCSEAEIVNMKDKIMDWSVKLKTLAEKLETSAAPILQPFF